ncbi:MAG: hypothetical protein MJ164_03670 [Alphaproteobacteria bacterium]|nr:hypothetical protein [Alphaproteobacteria bacterium]
MHKKHIFLRVFSKITIFACVFCVFSAWAETTTCDINFTPVTGNSIQNGTPTPENPVEVVSVGNKTDFGIVDGSYYDQNGNVIINSGFWRNTEYIPVKPNTTITISGCGETAKPKLIVYNSQKTRIDYWSIGNRSITLQVSNTAYIRLSAANIYKNTIQITDSKGNIIFTNKYQMPIVGTMANGSQTTASIYINEPLRKVGEYADELRPDGTVIRRVGVKVLDGTENWTKYANAYPFVPNLLPTNYATGTLLVSNYYSGNTANSGSADYGNYSCWVQSTSQYPRLYIRDDRFTTLSGTTGINDFKAYLAQQYANGTPVTVYYPLATEVVENWSCGPIAEIKIATTKFVDEEFAAAEAKLATTVQTIESVVSRTITQTGQIQVLQDTKQTRPDETCPANMKCLLVQDEDGTPHWYPIIEP